MDFISIADTAWSLHRKLATGSNAEDDDFAEISGGSASLSSASASASGQSLGLDAASSMHLSQEEISVLTGDQTRPFLSPSAEAELLLLATNFLLCKCFCCFCFGCCCCCLIFSLPETVNTVYWAHTICSPVHNVQMLPW